MTMYTDEKSNSCGGLRRPAVTTCEVLLVPTDGVVDGSNSCRSVVKLLGERVISVACATLVEAVCCRNGASTIAIMRATSINII